MTQPRGASLWADALTAVRLLAVDAPGLGGAAVRAAPGPVREAWLSALNKGVPQSRKLPPGIEDDRLLGGIDLSATLKAGRPVVQSGVLAEVNGGLLIVPMAERLSAGLGARIAAVMDQGEVVIEREGIHKRTPTRFGLVLLDEGIEDDERPPAALLSRAAFHINLQQVGVRDLSKEMIDPAAIQRARKLLSAVKPASKEILAALTITAVKLGIDAVTAPLLALRAARAAAALNGRSDITPDDAVLAAQLVLAPRALHAPQEDAPEQPPDQQPDQPDPPPDTDDPETDSPSETMELSDLVLEAVQAALPEGLLAELQSGLMGRSPPSHSRGAGALQSDPRRGRPIGVRAGALKSGARLALVATLRAAAPWQPLRRGENKVRRIEVRPEDFRIRKFAQSRESTIVFCVDASGSTAFNRLAEAKGAVELLLGEAYVTRTYASLVAFRNTTAEVLLPPTRSLARAKALLAQLPGGGGTPLAAGLEAGAQTAELERKKGRTPLIVVLTDGRGNIALDGTPNRSKSLSDALDAAKRVALLGLPSVVVDTSPRPRDDGAQLAHAMNARYIALPYANAAAVRDAVRAAAPTS